VRFRTIIASGITGVALVNDSSLVSSKEGVEVDLVAAAATEREFCKVEAAINIVGAAAREMSNRFLRGESGIARGEGNVATLVNAAAVQRRAKVGSHRNCATKINENDRDSLRVGGCIMFGFFLDRLDTAEFEFDWNK
jgi:hypothetical protein